MAQVLVHRTLSSQPRLETRRLEVNPSAVGALIGRGGDNVRRMQNLSRCKIDIERSPSTSEFSNIRFVRTHFFYFSSFQTARFRSC